MPEGKEHSVAKLRDEPCIQLFDWRVKEVMFDSNHDLWRFLKEGMLRACDEVCEFKKNRICNAKTWWWNSGVKDEILKKKEAFKKVTKISLKKQKQKPKLKKNSQESSC